MPGSPLPHPEGSRQPMADIGGSGSDACRWRNSLSGEIHPPELPVVSSYGQTSAEHASLAGHPQTVS